MFRWLIVVFLVLLLINGLTPLLGRLGFGKLPGDMTFRLRGRTYTFPFATTIIFSLLLWLVSRII